MSGFRNSLTVSSIVLCAHLRFTRSLTFEGARPPPERQSQLEGRPNNMSLPQEKIDLLILKILQMVPKDTVQVSGKPNVTCSLDYPLSFASQDTFLRFHIRTKFCCI